MFALVYFGKIGSPWPSKADLTVARVNSSSTSITFNFDAAVKEQKGKSTIKIVPGAIYGGAGVWDSVMKAVPMIKKTLPSAK